MNKSRNVIVLLFAIIFWPIRLLANRIQRAMVKLPTTTSPAKPFSHIILWTTAICLIALIVWAYFAVIDESTTATATVVPVTYAPIIQNLEGGIISSMNVKEGDIVKPGQILLTLDPTRFVSSYEETDSKVNSLKVKIARLNAEVLHQPLVFSPELQKESPDLIVSAQSNYESRQREIEHIQASITYLQKELSMTEPLVKEGAASSVEVLRLRSQGEDLKHQLDEFYSRAYTDLEASKAELASLNETLLALKDRLDRTTIRSPIRGIVKQINVGTVGSVVSSNTEIMSIVPLEDTLLVQAQVKPNDIGFIHPGQKVLVKISAYDYSIYGGLEGTVDKISADTITSQKGDTYYLVNVKTDRNYLRTPKNPLYIIPGMTATVNILTGSRTILNYLLSPIMKARENALRER